MANPKTTREVLTWVAPALGIPALRFFQDAREQRKELFVRDASTYTIGALIFLGTRMVGQSLLRRSSLPMSKAAKDMTAFMVALGANIVYAGVGSVRLSQLFRQTSAQPSIRKNPPPQSIELLTTSSGFYVQAPFKSWANTGGLPAVGGSLQFMA